METRRAPYFLKIILSSLLLIIIGYSSYTTIFIRATQNPSINMNSPNTKSRFLSYMNRDQYGEVNSFDKAEPINSPLATNWKRWTGYKDFPTSSNQLNFMINYQMNEMYWRYFAFVSAGMEDPASPCPKNSSEKT